MKTTKHSAASIETRSSKRCLARLWTVGATLALAMFGVVPAAMAEAPANDTRAGAIEVGTLPFSYTEKTRQATAGGPTECGNSGSVYFRFVPQASGLVQVDTIGSSYDTILTVFTTSPNGPNVIRCSDDRVSYWAATQFNARAGTEYFLMAGRCCGSGRGGGGDLVLHVTQVTDDPFEGSVTIEGGAVDPDTGIVTIEGTATCNRVSGLYVDGQLRQLRSEIFLARGWFEVYDAYCVPGTTTHWSASADSETGVVFGPGDARIRWGSIVMRDFDGWHKLTPVDPTPVTLT